MDVEDALKKIAEAALDANPGNQARVDMVMAVVGQLCEGTSMRSTWSPELVEACGISWRS